MYIQKTKFISHKQCLFGLLFSRNTRSLIQENFLSCQFVKLVKLTKFSLLILFFGNAFFTLFQFVNAYFSLMIFFQNTQNLSKSCNQFFLMQCLFYQQFLSSENNFLESLVCYGTAIKPTKIISNSNQRLGRKYRKNRKSKKQLHEKIFRKCRLM